MNAPDYAARAAAGAALLDERRPGWAERIDLDRLDMSGCQRCVLGQLGGNFHDTRQDLNLDLADAARLGFTLHDAESRYDWDQLGAAWTAEIRKRRDPAQAAS